MKKRNQKSPPTTDLICTSNQAVNQFGVCVSGGTRKSTEYFATMAKVASNLLLIDKYLCSCFPMLKICLSHLMTDESIGDNLIIEEITGFDGAIGDHINRYLRLGKELILSSLSTITAPTDIDLLLLRLTDLVNALDHKLADNDYLDGFGYNSLSKVNLARLLDHLWHYFEEISSCTSICLISVDGTPRAKFKARPNLKEWLGHDDDTEPSIGLFHLIAPNLENNKKWRARLIGAAKGKPLEITIQDPQYLERLQSCKSNESNGILIGDILKASYETEYDPIANKSTFIIIKVHERIRADELMHQDDLPFLGA